MTKLIRKSSTKNPPILSHEFVIQNHADIVSCVAMVFVVGLMVQATTPLASVFIALQHNVTESVPGEIMLYTSGIKDLAGIFFYSLICIVIHAIIQEYVLDKVSKRLHLSKSKLAVFSTSGQLAIFYLVSVVWGYDVMLKERYLTETSLLWNDYPAPMTFMSKLFLIVQMAYALHELPELYFTRTKKEEYLSKALVSLATLTLIALPYFLNFNRLLVCLLTLHFTTSVVNHISQLIQTVDKDDKFSNLSRLVCFSAMFLCRAGSIILAVLTLWFGLAPRPGTAEAPLDPTTGHYNTGTVRLALLSVILATQMYLIQTVIARDMQRVRESKGFVPVVAGGKSGGGKKEQKKVKKVKKSEESDLPEVDQNTNKTLKKQKTK